MKITRNKIYEIGEIEKEEKLQAIMTCHQCKKCAVENTAVLGCADENCKCHKDHKCGGELCIVCGYREKIEKEYTHPDCEHNCTSNCRREGCNCLCGEYHGKLDFGEYNEIIKERN